MNQAYKPVWVILAVVIGLAAVSGLWQWFGAKEIIPWRTDFAAARDEANRDAKPVLLYFTASWCGPCQEMKRTTWADRKVEEVLRAYVPVKVDVDGKFDLVKRYLYTPGNMQGGIPALRVLDREARIRKETVGGMSPQKFLKWLNAG